MEWIVLIILISCSPQSLFHIFGEHSKSTIYTCIQRHLHVPQIFQFFGKIQLFVFSLFFIFIFTLWSAGTTNFTWWQVLFLLDNTRSSVLTSIEGPVWISKSQRILWISLFVQSLVIQGVMGKLSSKFAKMKITLTFHLSGIFWNTID